MKPTGRCRRRTHSDSLSLSHTQPPALVSAGPRRLGLGRPDVDTLIHPLIHPFLTNSPQMSCRSCDSCPLFILETFVGVLWLLLLFVVVVFGGCLPCRTTEKGRTGCVSTGAASLLSRIGCATPDCFLAASLFHGSLPVSCRPGLPQECWPRKCPGRWGCALGSWSSQPTHTSSQTHPLLAIPERPS